MNMVCPEIRFLCGMSELQETAEGFCPLPPSPRTCFCLVFGPPRHGPSMCVCVYVPVVSSQTPRQGAHATVTHDPTLYSLLLIRYCQSRQSWVTQVSCYQCISIPRMYLLVLCWRVYIYNTVCQIVLSQAL